MPDRQGVSRYVIAGGVLVLVVVVGLILLLVGGSQDANDNGADLRTPSHHA